MLMKCRAALMASFTMPHHGDLHTQQLTFDHSACCQSEDERTVPGAAERFEIDDAAER